MGTELYSEARQPLGFVGSQMWWPYAFQVQIPFINKGSFVLRILRVLTAVFALIACSRSVPYRTLSANWLCRCQWRKAIVRIHCVFDGCFDLKHRTLANPYGLHIATYD